MSFKLPLKMNTNRNIKYEILKVIAPLALIIIICELSMPGVVLCAGSDNLITSTNESASTVTQSVNISPEAANLRALEIVTTTIGLVQMGRIAVSSKQYSTTCC